MKHRVELIRQSRVEVVTEPLALRLIDHSDRSLQKRSPQGLNWRAAIPQLDQEIRSNLPGNLVEERLIAAAQTWPHPLALDRVAPTGSRRDGAGVGAEPDQNRV